MSFLYYSAKPKIDFKYSNNKLNSKFDEKKYTDFE